MFLVDVEFNTGLFRRLGSFSGMLVPFVLGAALAPWLITVPGLFSEKVAVVEAILFLGAAMAITAFPVLARTIYERGLTGTALGTLALAAGAIDDAAAWFVLAIVLASFQKLSDESINSVIACWAVAWLNGEDNRTSLAVGTLMNLRGMMELMLINIGLQKGIIQPALFSMLVLMAVVTTLMASPVFEWVCGRHARKTGGPWPKCRWMCSRLSKPPQSEASC